MATGTDSLPGRIPLQADTVLTDSNWEHAAPCQGPAARVKGNCSHLGTYRFTKSSPTERSHKVNCVRPRELEQDQLTHHMQHYATVKWERKVVAPGH